MTYENRLTVDYGFGTLTAPTTTSDTTMQSAEFATLPAGLSTATYVPLTLQDPTLKTAEVVWATSHSASATTCSVVRARELTKAQAWVAGTTWTVTPTVRDGILSVVNRAALPTDPHVGMRAFVQDDQVGLTWQFGTGWAAPGGGSYRRSTLVAVDSGTVSFTSIPTTLCKLQIVFSARTVSTAYNVEKIYLSINGDSSPVYTHTGLTQINNSHGLQYNATPSAISPVGWALGSLGTQEGSGCGEVTFVGWAGASPRACLSWLTRGSYAYSVNTPVQWMLGGMYKKAGPYTSITLTPEASLFKAGSEFTLYGWE